MSLPTDLMELAYEDSKAEEGAIRGSGLFGDEVEVRPGRLTPGGAPRVAGPQDLTCRRDAKKNA